MMAFVRSYSARLPRRSQLLAAVLLSGVFLAQANCAKDAMLCVKVYICKVITHRAVPMCLQSTQGSR